jgi:hypothetical protein
MANFSDKTEPDPMEIYRSNIGALTHLDVVTAAQTPEGAPLQNIAVANDTDLYLWRTELYLVSKYQPQYAESSVWKLYSAAMERAKIVKEHHVVVMDLNSLGNQIVADLRTYAPWHPAHSSHHKGSFIRSPGIGKQYQKELDQL